MKKDIMFFCIMSLITANTLWATNDNGVSDSVHRSPHIQAKESLEAAFDVEKNLNTSSPHSQLHHTHKPSAPIKIACGIGFVTICAALGAYAHMN
jgi:hypothetical protein